MYCITGCIVIRPITGHTYLRVCGLYSTVFQLSSHLPRPLSSFPYATEFFFLPEFHFGRGSVFGPDQIDCSSKLSFRLWVLKHVSASVTMCRGSCWCCPDLCVFYVWLITFCQRHATLYYEVGASLSLLVCIANVCRDKVTLLCVSVCARTRNEKVF